MAKPKDPSIVIGANGKVLDITPTEAKATALRMFDEGKLLATIVEMPNGDTAVNVMGPPSMKLVRVMEEAVRNFRIAVEHAKR